MPLPLPSSIVTLLLANWPLAVIRSCLPSPLKSPIAMPCGVCPPVSKFVNNWNVPSGLPSKMLTPLLDGKVQATARSGWASLLK